MEKWSLRDHCIPYCLKELYTNMQAMVEQWGVVLQRFG